MTSPQDAWSDKGRLTVQHGNTLGRQYAGKDVEATIREKVAP